MTRKGFPDEVQTFSTKAEAVKWARSIEASMDAGGHVRFGTASEWTLKQLLERYLEEVTPTKRAGDTEAIRLRAMIRWKVAAFSLANLTPERIAALRDERLREVGPSTVIRDLALLSSAINHARREWGLNLQNPCLLVRKPAVPPGRDRVLTPQEEDRLLTALRPRPRLNPEMRVIVIVALETAMRRGELLAMRWEHVDLATRTVLLPMTKNGQARTVPLSSRAVEALSTLSSAAHGPVLHMSWMAVDMAFRVACRRANICGLRFHDLRHTATSRMAAKLPNLIELSAVTGHKTMQMLKRYYHPKASELALKLG